MKEKRNIPLDKNWRFKQADDAEAQYLPVAQFPTNIHLDLIANGLLPDPFFSKSELDVQWVENKAWIYQTTFTTPKDLLGRDVKAALVFEGLDTYATVTLNGEQILKTENMFIPERVDVTAKLSDQAENELIITFESALEIGKAIVKKYPQHAWGCWNGDASRLAVRKAQYHYGWDWGPRLLTCGPWRPISLETDVSRLDDLYFTTNVHESLTSAEIVLNADIEGQASAVRFSISFDDQAIMTAEVMVMDGFVMDGFATATFRIQNPNLWYPAGYGLQPLYELTATLFCGDDERDVVKKRFGLRRAEVVQHGLQGAPGKSFFFRINNIPLFCGGSNWIPADSFLPRVKEKKYRDWMKLLIDSNQIMLRIWGGGIYEEQALYDICDEFGILVWQDFCFACGNYPAFIPGFLELVRQEARANVKLLRHHPSIVIWAGNNEDYQYVESEGICYDPKDQDPQDWLRGPFSARYIYEKLLPEVVNELMPGTYYHPGSPWGGINSRDPTIGDIHQWNVWHGSQDKYQDYDKLVGRFVSEFGFEAFPDIRTIHSFLPQGSKDRYPQSSTIEFHNKAAGGERRLALYLMENIRFKLEPIEQFIYCTQLLQAECLGYAYRVWRREWKGPGKEFCAGALVWQLNDCWPATSWAIVDYYLRPKQAYYAIKRELAGIVIGMKRSTQPHAAEQDAKQHSRSISRIELWGSNLSLSDRNVDIQLRAWDVISGEEIISKTLRTGFLLGANRSTEITEIEVPVQNRGEDEETRTVVAAYFLEDGKQTSRLVNWPEPLKHVPLQKPQRLRLEVADDLGSLSLSAEMPVKGVVVEADDDRVSFEDNGVDLVPGETMSIGVKGLKEEMRASLAVRYLGL
ncbi:MAG: hypothetical protein M1816_006706 [Peltula sp. TS41687]|nr:MAG: hypothetical protein M1816_006706 [Peltula sp. TS41687]